MRAAALAQLNQRLEPSAGIKRCQNQTDLLVEHTNLYMSKSSSRGLQNASQPQASEQSLRTNLSLLLTHHQDHQHQHRARLGASHNEERPSIFLDASIGENRAFTIDDGVVTGSKSVATNLL